MALILDTRFLIAHTFPPTYEDRERVERFVTKILQEKFFIPSVVIVEYVRVAGRRIGKEAVSVRLRSWINAGAEVVPLTEELAFKAGELALKNPGVPLADTIVAVTALSLKARVVSDDPHYTMLGVKTVWYK